MEPQLRKLGNSTGLTLPPSLMRNLGLAAGQLMTLRKTSSGSRLLTPKAGRRKYSAAELSAQCSLKVPIPDDLMAWQQMVPMGNEAL